MSRGNRPARQRPTLKGQSTGFQFVDPRFELLAFRWCEFVKCARSVLSLVFRQCGEFAHERDQRVLDGLQSRMKGGVFEVSLGQTDGGTEFVDVTTGNDPRIAFAHSFGEQLSGFSRVSGLGSDAHRRGTLAAWPSGVKPKCFMPCSDHGGLPTYRCGF